MNMSEISWHQDLVKKVIEHFNPRARGPNGGAAAFEEAQKAGPTSMNGIIAVQGKDVFYAYYDAKSASGSSRHFNGKADLKRLLERLDEESPDRQRGFALMLSNALDSGSGEPSTTDGSGNKCQRTASANHSITTDRTTVPPSTTGAIPKTVPSPSDTMFSQVAFERARPLFQEDFWDSVEIIQGKGDELLADITMWFHADMLQRKHFGCQMQIGISPKRVADVARSYFDAVVEQKDGSRYVVAPGGTKVEGCPSITLCGCRHTIFSLFNADIDEAIRASPVYQVGQARLSYLTDAVSLSISNQATQVGKLTLYLGEWEASKIREQIFGH